MKHLELKSFGVQELNVNEMTQAGGGFSIQLAIGGLSLLSIKVNTTPVNTRLQQLEELDSIEVAIAGTATVRLIA